MSAVYEGQDILAITVAAWDLHSAGHALLANAVQGHGGRSGDRGTIRDHEPLI
jgi:hypothetical protein